MLQIKRWLAPPVFPDDEPNTRRANLLNFALFTCMALALCLIAGNLAGGTVPAVVTGLDIGLVVFCLVLRRIVFQGRVVLASGALLAVGLVGITLAVGILGTIRGPTTAMYMLLVITAGLLFDLWVVAESAHRLGWLDRHVRAVFAHNCRFDHCGKCRIVTPPGLCHHDQPVGYLQCAFRMGGQFDFILPQVYAPRTRAF